ncbi:cell growth regulator with RING finger domain protein 1 isoform X3 [Takifugu flavidus]|uniref:cell growth regulator with RING finger domain protein 1 isoform X3 n=1 Tax=Takifugu flavidus TaxID=433684 RepID=UPI0025446D58|nr:cell growth regulator with RING finger domain protein 1 isoform X3 [Takifugu flavidus]
MAAVFLVTLFEYSPLFYITLVSLCFIVTAAIVVGWCGFDVPVILRSSEETESILPPPEKQMVQVTNPFGLELTSGPASVTAGVSLRAVCLSPSVLSCFWGCEIRALQRGLQAHQSGTRLTTCHQFQEVLHSASLHFQRFNEDAQECLTQIPACQGVTDFGPLPRARYPLVAVLTLAEPAGRHIAASINIIHVPDSKYSSAARIIFQYLLTSQGNIYELKSLFMSADGGQVGQAPSRDQSLRDGQPSEEATTPAPGTRQEVEVEGCRDCVVCQSAAVSIVLLPCRHACVCHSCVAHFQHCPICRAFVLESFTLTGNQQPRWAHIRNFIYVGFPKTWTAFHKPTQEKPFPLDCCGNRGPACVYTQVKRFLLVKGPGAKQSFNNKNVAVKARCCNRVLIFHN